MSKRTITYIALILFPMLMVTSYLVYLRPAIPAAYAGDPDVFLKGLLDLVYPRFYVERNRFELEFFLHKADQVIFRTLLIYTILLAIWWLTGIKKTFSDKLHAWRYATTTVKNVHVLRILFFVYFFILIREMYTGLLLMIPVKDFYKPVLLLRLTGIPFPSYEVIFVCTGLLISLSLLILANVRVIFCTAAAFIIFLLMQCWVFSFEKIDHGFVTYTYAFMLLPFLFSEQGSAKETFNSWALQLIRISIAMVYFLSALEKIFVSGLSWMHPENLRGYFYLHAGPLTGFVSESDFLCITLGLSALLLQLTFILIVFLPRYKWIWIPGGVLFHTGTYVLMGIGHPLNPWLLVYIFFVDWTVVYDFFSGLWRKKNLSR